MSTCCSPTSIPETGNASADKARVLTVLNKPGMRTLIQKMQELGPCINSFRLTENMPIAELRARLEDLRSVGLVQGEIRGAPCFCVNEKTMALVADIDLH